MEVMPHAGADVATGPVVAPVGLRKALRVAALGVQSIRHARHAWRLSRLAEGSLFRRFVDDRPEIRGMVLTPLISARWSARRRLDALDQHFAAIERHGGLVAVAPETWEELVNLGGIRPGFHATLDSPRWLLRDGFLTISLWDGAQRSFMLTFCFGEDDGVPAVFIGGMQGVTTGDGGRLYKELTKAAFGLRPRDLALELLRAICAEMGIRRILAVSDAARHHHSRYSKFWIGTDPVKGSYDDAWIDRGGVLRADGLFDLPVTAPRRTREELPANKRTMYMARYAMLDHIEAAVAASLKRPPSGNTQRNRGDPRLPEATQIQRSA